jgi:hypothetical protein
MKNIGFIIVFFFNISNLFSQSITNKLLSKNIGMYFDCSLNEKIDLEVNDTTYYLFCSFQNMNYSMITDIGSIFCGNVVCMEDLLIDLKKINELYNQNPAIEYKVNSGGCSIELRNKNIYIYDKDKFTYLTPKYLLKYIEWLSEVLKLLDEKRIK